MTIMVCPGKDAEFLYYEDAGDGYDYEKGEFSVVPLRWRQAEGVLAIGPRKGAFEGMDPEKEFVVKVIGKKGEKRISWDGKSLVLVEPGR